MVAWIIDYAVLGTVGFLLSKASNGNRIADVATFLVLVVVYFAYTVGFTLRYTGTVGMRLTNLSVVPMNPASSLMILQVFIRSLFAAIPFAGFEVDALFGQVESRTWVNHHHIFIVLDSISLICASTYFWPVVDSKKQTVHDKIARTLVVANSRCAGAS